MFIHVYSMQGVRLFHLLKLDYTNTYVRMYAHTYVSTHTYILTFLLISAASRSFFSLSSLSSSLCCLSNSLCLSSSLLLSSSLRRSSSMRFCSSSSANSLRAWRPRSNWKKRRGDPINMCIYVLYTLKSLDKNVQTKTWGWDEGKQATHSICTLIHILLEGNIILTNMLKNWGTLRNTIYVYTHMYIRCRAKCILYIVYVCEVMCHYPLHSDGCSLEFQKSPHVNKPLKQIIKE